MATSELYPENPSEIMRNKLFNLQCLLCVDDPIEREFEKIQQAYGDAMRYCVSQADKTLELGPLDALPMWQDILRYLKDLRCKLYDYQEPAWKLEKDLDKLQSIYGSKEETFLAIMSKRLGWAEEHAMVSADTLDHVLETILWRGKKEPLPIARRCMDPDTVAKVLKEMDDRFSGHLSRIPIKLSEIFAIKKRLENAYRAKTESWRGGRFTFRSLKESLVATTAIRVAAGEEKIIEAAGKTSRWSDGHDDYSEMADHVAEWLAEDNENLRAALDVLKDATHIIESCMKANQAHRYPFGKIDDSH
jgi:hypothetical protein